MPTLIKVWTNVWGKIVSITKSTAFLITTSVVVLVLVLVGVFYTGVYFGEKNYIPGIEGVIGLSNKEVGKTTEVDFAPFWKTWNALNSKFVSVHKDVPVPNDQDKVYAAISGLVDSLGDPYTVFLPPQANDDFGNDIRGNFEGVGMEIGPKDKNIVVVAPLKNSPAEKAGLKTGDVIVKIDDKEIVPGVTTSDEAVHFIRGAAGTIVKISVIRGSEKTPRVFSIVREKINIPTVETTIKTVQTPAGISKVFVIHIFTFTADSPNLFREALREFIDAKTDKLVIDLRGNPGGYLEAAVDIASWFLPKGKLIVTEDFGSSTPPQIYRSSGYDAFTDKLKLAILVDAGSASASEILAGALLQNEKAILVGSKTFGKGSVQELVPITDNTSLKVTVAQWLTPDGTSISGEGISPTVKVGITEADVKAGRDPQLDKAIEVLMK